MCAGVFVAAILFVLAVSGCQNAKTLVKSCAAEAVGNGENKKAIALRRLGFGGKFSDSATATRPGKAKR